MVRVRFNVLVATLTHCASVVTRSREQRCSTVFTNTIEN